MPYIPNHLDYMLYELLKNASRATIEHHQHPARRRRGSLPPLQVCICEGSSDVTIRITDRGGGISDDDMQRVWRYGYTTGEHLNKNFERTGSGFGQDMTSAIDAGQRRFRMAGLGFGLPLSRVYARYFGGDLALKNIPGYGIDAFLHLKRLEGQDWEEKSDEYSGNLVMECGLQFNKDVHA